MSIEYVTSQWNPYSGCLHGPAICATSETCWAKTLSARFEQTCGGNFQPRYHGGRVALPYSWRTPRRVAVCFMGDLWGDWISAQDVPAIGYTNMDTVRSTVLEVAKRLPQHHFLFLTKNPFEYPKWNPWPLNAWVGMTLTGVETRERQAAMWEALGRVQGAGVRWLSYEPTLGPLAQPIPSWIDWVVVGRQTGKLPGPFDFAYLVKPTMWTECHGHKPLWEKNNLASFLGRPLCQELPHD